MKLRTQNLRNYEINFSDQNIVIVFCVVFTYIMHSAYTETINVNDVHIYAIVIRQYSYLCQFYMGITTCFATLSLDNPRKWCAYVYM